MKEICHFEFFRDKSTTTANPFVVQTKELPALANKITQAPVQGLNTLGSQPFWNYQKHTPIFSKSRRPNSTPLSPQTRRAIIVSSQQHTYMSALPMHEKRTAQAPVTREKSSSMEELKPYQARSRSLVSSSQTPSSPCRLPITTSSHCTT